MTVHMPEEHRRWGPSDWERLRGAAVAVETATTGAERSAGAQEWEGGTGVLIGVDWSDPDGAPGLQLDDGMDPLPVTARTAVSVCPHRHHAGDSGGAPMNCIRLLGIRGLPSSEFFPEEPECRN